MKLYKSPSSVLILVTIVIVLSNTGIVNALYVPHLGQFTSRDPVAGKFKEPLTLHRYLYCINDPINRIDPSGEMSYLETVESSSIGSWLMSSLTRAATTGLISGLKSGVIGLLKTQTGTGFAKGFVTGFTGGAVPAFFGLYGVVGQAVGGAITSGTESYLDGDSIGKMVANTLAGGAIGAISGKIWDKGYEWQNINAEGEKQLRLLLDPLMGSLSGDVEMLFKHLAIKFHVWDRWVDEFYKMLETVEATHE